MSMKFKTPDWMVEWQKKYQPLLVEGLTDGPTYVRLAKKSLPSLDVVLAFRPLIGRVSADAVMIGGKLSVFPVADSIKAEAVSEGVQVSWLKSAYPKIEWPKVSPERVGTLVASAQNAPYHSGAEYIEAFKASDTVEKMVAYIEELTGEPVEERKLALRAIREAMLGELNQQGMFDPLSLNKPVENPAELKAENYEAGDKVVSITKKKVIEGLVAAVTQVPAGSFDHDPEAVINELAEDCGGIDDDDESEDEDDEDEG